MSGPYAYAATDYWNAGWHGVLLLPPKRKAHPPAGYTGWDGIDPSFPDVMAWAEQQPDGNIGLHLPDGVLGIDVDNYGDKIGGATLARREAEWGELPATWRTTSRDDGISGIRLYRVPVLSGGRPLHWPGKVGPGIETVHRGHRYAVVPPSIHPEGRAYRWITPDSSVSTDAPRLADLPELPWAWVVGLTQGHEAHTYQGAGMNDDDIKAWLQTHNTGTEPCGPMQDALDAVLENMVDGAHESLSGLMRVVSLAGRGHEGLYPTLHTLRPTFLRIAGARRDGGRAEAELEWTRSLFGAVDKIVGSGELPLQIDGDPCEFGVLEVAPSPAVDSPVDQPREDASDQVPAESIDQPAPEPRELTEEEQAELAAARRENEIARKTAELEVAQEARRRLAAKDAPAIELLGIDEFLARPRPQPLVDGLLYRNSLSRIFGAPGCGKSFVAIDIALRMALGWDWNGSKVEQGKVVYVMAEGDAVNNERAHAWMDRHQVKADQLRGRFLAVPHKVLLLEEAIEPFIERIKDEHVDLVVLDTKNRMMVGNENHSEDNATMVRALDAIRVATGCCALLIDHTGLNATGRAKGDNSTEGSMETEAEVINDKQSPPKVTVEITRNKAREVGRQWDFFLRHHPIEIEDEVVPAAVLLPIGDDVDLPAARPSAKEIEGKWREEDRQLPGAVLDYDGPGKAAVPDLARFMAHDAGSADPDGIGVTRVQAASALSVQKLGKTLGHSDAAVRRAWSALRAMGYLAPADGHDGSDGKAENTTGRHVWTARG